MKKTYTTRMPDQVGAFLSASEIISSLGLNITRVSYNKAIDLNTLFLEVEGGEEAIEQATVLLTEKGYILDMTEIGNVILVEFLLPDVPGAVLPVLRLIHSYQFNISYMSSQADGSGVQHFRMGLFVENNGKVSDFLQKATLLCKVQVLEYTQGERLLDNTVFYVSFANRIAELRKLDQEQKLDLIVQSNQIMENLRERPKAQFKTFEYLRRFAEQLSLYHGDAFEPRMTRYSLPDGVSAFLLEPPCGSNVCVLERQGKLVVVDGGLYSYQAETLAALQTEYPDFLERERYLILTHADVDHCALNDFFERIYVSQSCAENFRRELRGKECWREKNPVHAPYARISKVLSGYHPPEEERLRVIGGRSPEAEAPLEPIGSLALGGMEFQVYEGAGGHVPGEIVLVERRLRILFTGDIFINVKEQIPRQQKFNKLAPYLMISVDTEPELARREREAIFSLLEPGEWLLFGGHGAGKTVVIP